MKKKLFFTLSIVLLIASSGLFFSGCDSNEPLGINSAAPEFSIELFEENLTKAINDRPVQNQPVGWAYVINKDGQYYSSGGFGKARLEADAPSVSFSENKVINVASISKFFTAIAVMQLLDQRKLSVDSKIAPWLPPSWNLNATGIDNLTFKDLLTHRSGLQSTNTNFPQTLCYSCLQSVISTGVVGNKNQRNYLNANFALFRVIIPSLWRGLPGGPAANESLADANTQARYIQYMQEKVFIPAGVANADCVNENASGATLYYRPTDGVSNTSGVQYGDWTALSAGGGYYLSAVEIAKVLAFYENTEALLSNASKTIMKENRIGFDQPDGNGREWHGKYYGKNGSIADVNNRGLLTQTLSFPMSKVEVVVVMNTQLLNFPNGNTISGVLHDAYNDAWVLPKNK